MEEEKKKKNPDPTKSPPNSSDAETNFTSSSTSSTSSINSSIFFSSEAVLPLPHSRSSGDPHWPAIRAAVSASGAVQLRHLSIIRHVGSGNLARVFHCRLHDTDGADIAAADFALKVVDLSGGGGGEARAAHVRSEAAVLAELDHPFLPTLYARLDASHYACFLIDYCPGGDLHALLRRQRRLPPAAVRFYAAEVLLAIEYLHALSFVYRDLKPENVLLRADGHVMLSDFDLCFRSGDAVPASLLRHRRRRRHISCFSAAGTEEEEVEFVAEPVGATSREHVGTHEYLAPEMVSGDGHGAGVDWWAFGVFLYELLHGRTPFKGLTKKDTLRNIVAEEVRFSPAAVHGGGGDAAAARDLIRRLLVKDQEKRMGCMKGAAEIKKHPFFDGVAWALIRSCKPLELGSPAVVVVTSPEKKQGRIVGRFRRKMADAASSGLGWK